MTNKQQARYAAKFTRDLIELLNGNNGEHWTKRTFSSLLNWRGNFANDKKPCYCVSGGIRELVRRGRSNKIGEMVFYSLTDMVGDAIPSWNDSRNTEWKHVKKTLTTLAKKFDALANS